MIGAVPGAERLLTCPLRALTGIPCPLCGGTTSMVRAVHADLVGAFQASPLGVTVVALALILAVARPRPFSVPLALVSAVLVAAWLFQLHRFGFV